MHTEQRRINNVVIKICEWNYCLFCCSDVAYRMEKSMVWGFFFFIVGKEYICLVLNV